MIEGFATPEGTTNFAGKSLAHKENFRKIHDLTLSNVGIGTYLGNTDLETDTQQKNAIKESILRGVNVIDTAINKKKNSESDNSFKVTTAALNNFGKLSAMIGGKNDKNL